MANTSRPFGLRPVRYRNGSPWTGKGTPYYVPASYATALFIGDPVIITGTSNTSEVTRIGGKFRPGALPEVNVATAGADNAITGVIVGFMSAHRDSDIYGPASTERIALVCDDVNVVFQVQDDGSGSGLAATDVGNNANLVAGSGGSSVTGQSSWQLDATTPATTANFQVKIIGVSNIEGENNLGEDYVIWDVVLNRTTWTAAAGVPGV